PNGFLLFLSLFSSASAAAMLLHLLRSHRVKASHICMAFVPQVPKLIIPLPKPLIPLQLSHLEYAFGASGQVLPQIIRVVKTSQLRMELKVHEMKFFAPPFHSMFKLFWLSEGFE
ncbi:unnamed protein product, partial [Prunus brigantina]